MVKLVLRCLPCRPVTKCQDEAQQEQCDVEVVQRDVDVVPGVSKRLERVLVGQSRSSERVS